MHVTSRNLKTQDRLNERTRTNYSPRSHFEGQISEETDIQAQTKAGLAEAQVNKEAKNTQTNEMDTHIHCTG